MRRLALIVGSLATLLSKAVFGQLEPADNSTMPTVAYKTMPQSWAPAMNISSSGNFSHGYIFIAPYQAPGSGPYIYDKFGNLVWDGFGVVGAANVHDFKVCTYNNSAALCAALGNQQPGYSAGMAIIIDSNYKVINTVQTGGNARPVDQHEFQLINGGEGHDTAIVTSYQTIPFDLSHFNITNGQGWLSQGAFQEIDVDTGEVLFEWYSSNHVDPSATQIQIGASPVDGDGLTPHTAFDYFHINSVDKSMSGNYLVSSRHAGTIYYVNATDRTITWKLSFLGESDFQLTNFNFSFQHDARILQESADMITISFFDNASNGESTNPQTSAVSSGRIVELYFGNHTATQISQTFPPNDYLSTSQGNTQLLAGGNVFHGWGSIPAFSEHDPDGSIVLNGTFAVVGQAPTFNYRAFSFEWQSTPATTRPAVYSYALTTSSSNTIYVSWNGATTVAIWNFYAADAIGDEFVLIGTTGHRGFETVWTAPGYHLWVMVEAVGPDGTSLRNSSFQPTFTPSSALVNSCDESQCGLASA